MRRFDPATLAYLGFLSIPGWLYDSVAWLRLFGLFFLFFGWPFVASFWQDSADDPADWIDIGDRAYLTRYYVSMLLVFTNPFYWAFVFGQLIGHLTVLGRYFGRLPDDVDRPDAPAYRLPFDGTWTVLNGGITRNNSHSWGVFAQRYAYDFVVTDEEGKTHDGDESDLEAYYCFDRRVKAPAAGTVIATKNEHRDYPRPGGWLDPFQRDLRGNFVIIDHGNEYSVLAHLRQGSVTVRQGDHVAAGQVIGTCGNSGNTTEPHLHFHVQDRPKLFFGMGLPIPFVDLQIEDQVHESETTIQAGQRVRPATD